MSTAEGRRYVRTERFASMKDHVYAIVREAGHHGVTNLKAVAVLNEQTPDEFRAYSNPVSGALSRLHNVDRRIVRLKERRGGLYVYVANEHIDGRDYFLPRPPDGHEGDRLTPALVLEVLDGLGAIGGDYLELSRRVWRQARDGDVSEIQAAVDQVRGRGPR